MGTVPFENRYAVITEKNPREIVLLRGTGCKWRRCRFCDYHLDFNKDMKENEQLNRNVLKQVTGLYHKLEVINSGSFTELDEGTMNAIEQICIQKQITELHFESHWNERMRIPALKERLLSKGITVKIKIGVETFAWRFRESYLDKGIAESDPQKIAAWFDEVCLLQGLPGQTASSMQKDIEIGLQFFERVCVNLMVENTKPILPDPLVRQLFIKKIYPLFQENPRVDILINNTDLGVGI